MHAKLRNRTCQGLHRQGQGQGRGLIYDCPLLTGLNV